MSNDLLLPTAGSRRYNNGLSEYRGSFGFYRSSSPYSSRSYLLYFAASYVYPQNNYERAYAFSVRCFKNADNTPPEIQNITVGSIVDEAVVVTVDATDNQALASEAYSFDKGTTWQAANTKSFTGNQIVEVVVRDEAGNIATGSVKIDSFITTTYP
jgi:hypothetical protein